MMIREILRYGFILMLALGLTSCDSGREEAVTEADYSNCRYEKPEAIFYDGLPQISDHTFGQLGRGSEEHFVLSGSIEVTILQYGCDFRTQEFIFKPAGQNDCDSSEDCAVQIAQLLQALSRLGPEYHVFRAWGQAIKKIAPQVSYDESIKLADGFWIKVGKQKSFGSTTLLLTLSEKP